MDPFNCQQLISVSGGERRDRAILKIMRYVVHIITQIKSGTCDDVRSIGKRFHLSCLCKALRSIAFPDSEALVVVISPRPLRCDIRRSNFYPRAHLFGAVIALQNFLEKRATEHALTQSISYVCG